MLSALQSIEQKIINDFQSEKFLKSAYIFVTINPATTTRSSSKSNFLNAALKSTALKIYNNILTQKLLFTDKNIRDVSVSSRSSSSFNIHDYVLNVRKEVIISTDAFQFPQLLMMSGIDPRKILKSLDISILKNLSEIGPNFWNQIWYETTFRVNISINSAKLNSFIIVAAAVNAYLITVTSSLFVSGTNVLEFKKLSSDLRNALFVITQKTLDDTFSVDWSDLEFLSANDVMNNQSNYLTQNSKDEFNYVFVVTTLIAPLNRKNISINNINMSDSSFINFNWFSDFIDIKLSIAAFKRQRQVWTYMRNLIIELKKISDSAIQNDDEILNFIRRIMISVWHAAVICKMGHISDNMTVVDTRARIYKIRELRIVDASSFSFLPPGHPQTIIYALAEKIANEILQNLQNSVATLTV